MHQRYVANYQFLVLAINVTSRTYLKRYILQQTTDNDTVTAVTLAIENSFAHSPALQVLKTQSLATTTQVRTHESASACMKSDLLTPILLRVIGFPGIRFRLTLQLTRLVLGRAVYEPP